MVPWRELYLGASAHGREALLLQAAAGSWECGQSQGRRKTYRGLGRKTDRGYGAQGVFCQIDEGLAGVFLQNARISVRGHRMGILWTRFNVCMVAQRSRFAPDTEPNKTGGNISPTGYIFFYKKTKAAVL